MSRGYRTFTPWGHVGRADRAARQDLMGHIRAHSRISKEPEWSELYELMKRKTAGESIDADRANTLADALNAKGFTDRDIERAF